MKLGRAGWVRLAGLALYSDWLVRLKLGSSAAVLCAYAIQLNCFQTVWLYIIVQITL